MKYFLIAGEASGDLHASNLMKGIKDVDPDADFRFFGGDLMEKIGGTLVKHYREMAYMGFLEVLMNLRSIVNNLKHCKESILQYNPDVVILVDYPGFNLRMARFAKENGFRVFYYIAPKVWAWRESRVELLKQYVDKLFVIFPFEVKYFSKHGIEAIYEGNPLIDTLAFSNHAEASRSLFLERYNLESKPIIAILAGSRKQEIKYNLPNMLTLEDKTTDYQLVIAGAPSLDESIYSAYLSNSRAKLIFGQTQELLSHSAVAVVTSGTATLEAALLNVPEVVCYRGNTVSMFIAWLVIKVKYISLVNLIMGREVVTELKQFDFTPRSLWNEVEKILPNETKRMEMLEDFSKLKDILGTHGASSRVAKRMIETIKANN